MSKPSCDLNGPHPTSGPVVAADPNELPGAPPPSPNGRILYENLGIRIDKDCVWHYHGSPIRRKELVCMFAHALTRDGDGRHWLVTPAEVGPIEVEDSAFLAVEMFVGGRDETQTISFRTDVDEIVTVDADHPMRAVRDPLTGETVPYVTMRHRLEARVIRPVYYELAALGFEDELDGSRCVVVWSSGLRFSLGVLEEVV